MYRRPPRPIEFFVGLLLPPASREHVLGDLHERCTGPVQYVGDAILTVPLVIASRIRRVTDPDVFLMEALSLYVAYLGSALILAPAVLYRPWGLLRLAIPAAVALMVSTLAAAYSDPRRRSPLQPIRDAAIGVACAFLCQDALSLVARGWVLPGWVMAAGSCMSLLLISALRILFSSAGNRPQGVTTTGPLLWHNRVTRLMEYVGLFMVVGGVGAMVLFIVFLLQNKG